MLEAVVGSTPDRTSPMDLFSTRTATLSHLGAASQARIRNLGRSIERYAAGEQLYGSDEPLRASMRTAVVTKGWAYEMRILFDGRRQIFSFLLPGDLIVFTSKSDVAKRAVIALTNVDVVDASSLLRAGEQPVPQDLADAFADAARIREERLLDHIVRLGRQSAYERVVHMLLELRDRLAVVGLVKEDSFRLPLTQEIMADALGLSIVHINRTLQQLRQEGLIALKCGAVTLCKPKKLLDIAGYSDRVADFAGERRPAEGRYIGT